jgi:hypothetical protein
LYEKNGTEKTFQVLKNTWRYWAADPFIISVDNTEYLFFEMYDRLKGKGLLGYRVIENGKIGKMKVAYESKQHLSYPFIFRKNNDFFIIPETSEEGNLVLLKADKFPDKWRKESIIMSNICVCDSTLFHYEGKDYLLTQPYDKHYKFDLLEIYVNRDGKWIPHNQNPIALGTENARQAGKVIFSCSGYIRVSQNCINGYGRGINFNRILSLDDKTYSEEKIRSISVNDIKHNGASHRYIGIHTYNASEYYEVIDLKNVSRVHLGNIIYGVYRIIHYLMSKIKSYIEL